MITRLVLVAVMIMVGLLVSSAAPAPAEAPVKLEKVDLGERHAPSCRCGVR